jgi:hypothetical protein
MLKVNISSNNLLNHITKWAKYFFTFNKIMIHFSRLFFLEIFVNCYFQMTDRTTLA